jgi:hypothetical protein
VISRKEDVAASCAKRAAADIEGHSETAEFSQPGRLSTVVLGSRRFFGHAFQNGA